LGQDYILEENAR